jgi:hypothetical protein
MFHFSPQLFHYNNFFIPLYLQSVSVHSANCAKTYAVACRRVLSSAPLQLTRSKPPVASGNKMAKSCRTHDHILLSHLRPLQCGGPGPHIYIPQEESGPVIPSGTGFLFHNILRLAGLWWGYSNLPLLGQIIRESSSKYLLLFMFKFKTYWNVPTNHSSTP